MSGCFFAYFAIDRKFASVKYCFIAKNSPFGVGTDSFKMLYYLSGSWPTFTSKVWEVSTMKKELRNYIKLELSLYRKQKDSLMNSDPNSLTGCRYMSMLAYLVANIDCALATLPDDIRKYAQIRYFGEYVYKREHIARRLKVSERTINRWDERLLSCVAIHIGILPGGFEVL